MAIRGIVSEPHVVPTAWAPAVIMIAAVICLGGGIVGEDLVFAVVGAMVAAVAAVLKLVALRAHTNA